MAAQAAHSLSRAGFSLALAVLASAAGAETLYKYRDSGGGWVYSDRMPTAAGHVRANEVADAAEAEGIRLQRGGDDSDGLVLEAVNELPVWVQIAFRAESARNVDPQAPISGNRLLAPRSTTELIRLPPLELGAPSEVEFSYQFILGHPGARHRPAQPYRLPYQLTDAHRVAQAFPDTQTHSGLANRYAVDFEMPVGTGVFAARGGVVVEVAAEFVEAGFDLERDAARANFVRILHDDGTLALYGHLDWRSVRVAPGQIVMRGERLADSGNTGYSFGPHLHFVVQRNRAGEVESVPIEFVAPGGALRPVTGDRPVAR